MLAARTSRSSKAWKIDLRINEFARAVVSRGAGLGQRARRGAVHAGGRLAIRPSALVSLLYDGSPWPMCLLMGCAGIGVPLAILPSRR